SLFDGVEKRHRFGDHALNVAAESRLAVHQGCQVRAGNITHHGGVHDADLAESYDGAIHMSARISRRGSSAVSRPKVSASPSAKVRGANPKSRSAAVMAGGVICRSPNTLSTVSGGFFRNK